MKNSRLNFYPQDTTAFGQNEELFFSELCPTDKFVERNEINQFLRDGSVINALYDKIVLIYFAHEQLRENKDSLILRVFNAAYKICWLITAKSYSFDEVTVNVKFRKVDSLVRDLSYSVAWSILKVYGGFYDFDKTILDDIRLQSGHRDYFNLFRELVRMQDEPTRPICFSCPGVRMPESGTDILGEPGHSEVESIFDFILNPGSMKEANPVETNCSKKGKKESEPVKQEIAADDIINQSVNAIKSLCKSLQERNFKLTYEIERMGAEHSKQIETLEASNERLRFQIQVLQTKLKNQETKVITKEVVKVKEVPQENPLAKILSWDSIADYGLGLGNYKDVQVILNMLNRLSTRNHYFDPSLDSNIAKVENYLRELQKPMAPHVEGDFVVQKTVGQQVCGNKTEAE